MGHWRRDIETRRAVAQQHQIGTALTDGGLQRGCVRVGKVGFQRRIGDGNHPVGAAQLPGERLRFGAHDQGLDLASQ